MRNRDDTSNSRLARKLLEYQNPWCANYKFVDLFGYVLVNRKWTDVQHKNYMNKKLVKLDALYTDTNQNITTVFELLPNGEFEQFPTGIGFDEFTAIAFTVMLEKCL